MTSKEAADMLDLIIKKAPALKKAGVSRVAMNGVSFFVGDAPPEKTDDNEDSTFTNDASAFLAGETKTKAGS